MTLTQADTKVRQRTRHVGDTARLTEAALWSILNDKYRELRTELQSLAPTLHLETGPALTIAAGDTLSTGGAERVFRVERYLPIEEKWVPVARADTIEPSQNIYAPVAWEERAGCIVLHPEGEVSSDEYGTFRVLYYVTPADLTDGAHVFTLPVMVEQVLIYRACAEVAMLDGDSPKDWLDRADDALERAMPALHARYGVHEIETFREVLGY